MPLQNRVSPFSIIEAVAARGTFMGNRGGALHDENRRLGRARWKGKRWITCLLAFKGRRREVMAANKYTELFFLDEATAFAAGHRPCCECRGADYARFVAAWRVAAKSARDERLSANGMDVVLHVSRLSDDRMPRRYRDRLDALPDGTMIVHPGEPDTAALIWQGQVHPWSFEGYGSPAAFGAAIEVEVLTPKMFVEVFRAGYAPEIHASMSRA